ncbi:hypothetical protein [Labrys wisconsinensis]|uniref:Sialate O-acetylesterase domain-containing protein n=1 Tax=Labrys wisconsinensis TaxID=425677 RepID=A0ABU0J511_9HYPH|nr:hypothetical protein [Labrys wisconsinensis]MDQ0469347.1 hypothetical protein [Labrys wisconsinensis]
MTVCVSRRAALALAPLAMAFLAGGAAPRSPDLRGSRVRYMPIDGQSNAYNPPSGAISPFAGLPPAADAFGFANYFAQRGPKPADVSRMDRLSVLQDHARANASLAVLLAHALAGGGPARLWNTTGQGARPLGTFLPGGTCWDNALTAARQARQVIEQSGGQAELGPYVFVHGETGPHSPVYETLLRQFAAAIRPAIAQAFGAPSMPPLMLVQINEAEDAGDHTWPAQSQYKVARDTPGVHLACPLYYAPLHDLSHTTLPGRVMFAAALADAIATLEQTGQWQPLWPTSVKRQGAVIRVRFHVPYGGALAIDQDWVRPTPNYGFQFTDDSGAPPPISAAAISGRDEVTVTLAAEPRGGNPRLRYAWLNDLDHDGWSGGRGQVMTVTSKRSPFLELGLGVPEQLRHYAVRFEEPCS